MMGEPIEAVRQGVQSLLAALRSDPQALETVHLSVITFASTASQAAPLADVMQFRMPELTAGGASALGSALNVLMDSIGREVRRATKDHRGDWRPLVFIITDGMATDRETFRQAAGKLKASGMASVLACAAGNQADIDCLKQITDHVMRMNTLSDSDMARYFVWVSDMVGQTSKSLQSGYGRADERPDDFVIVP